MRRISFFLRDQGFKVWVDNEKLIPGTAAWEESIENAIKQALAVVVVLSPESKNSEWVRREITFADQFNKRVFPVLVKGSEEDSLPLRLITRQYIDMRQDENQGLSNLHAALTFYVEKKQTLEMKRPVERKKAINALPAIPISVVSSQNKPLFRKWILPAGIFATLCILLIGALWMGYQFFSVLPSSTQSNPTLSISTISIPVETPSHIPANTSVPNLATVAVPDITLNYLNNVQTLSTDTFDDPLGGGWNIDINAGKIDGGDLKIIGNENWDGASRNKKIGEGQGIIVDFSYPTDSLFEVFMDSGEYQTDSYRRFGMYIENNRVELNQYKGSTDLGGAKLSGDLTLESVTTYSLLIAILPNGEFVEIVWNPSDTSKTMYDHEKLDATWAGRTWTFNLKANQGTILFDNFREIKFSGAK